MHRQRPSVESQLVVHPLLLPSMSSSRPASRRDSAMANINLNIADMAGCFPSIAGNVRRLSLRREKDAHARHGDDEADATRTTSPTYRLVRPFLFSFV